MNNYYSSSCGCNNPEMPQSNKGSRKSLAMAYVPWQKWQNVMDGCSGLKNGTIFEELVLPFEGSRAACSQCAGNTRNNNYNNNYNYNRRGMR